MNLKHNQTYAAKTRKQKDLLSGTGNDQWTSFPSLHSPIHFCHSPKPDSWNRLWRRWQSGTLCPHRLPGYRHWFIRKPHPASPPVLPEERLPATFIASDIFQIIQLEEAFDIILIHDVIEHISEKYRLLEHIKRFLTPGGLLFISFPPWQMPFGGHQQICRNKYVSRLPFIHLLPAGIYSSLLHHFGESQARIDELLDIRKCRTSIELFEKLLCTSHYRIFHKQFWFINPHYEQKFHLKPRKLPRLIGSIPHLRNFFCTSCFYLIQSWGTVSMNWTIWNACLSYSWSSFTWAI